MNAKLACLLVRLSLWNSDGSWKDGALGSPSSLNQEETRVIGVPAEKGAAAR